MDLSNLPKDLVEKIQKLLRLQERAGSIEEAANAASKVRAMLLKYNLDLETVQMAGGSSSQEEPICRPSFNTDELTKKSEGGWIRSLTEAIAKQNMCTVIGTGQTIGLIYIIGTATNAELVWYMVEELSHRIRGMSREAFRKYDGREKRNTYFRGYYVGAVQGIRSQMEAKIEEERAAARIVETYEAIDRTSEQCTQLATVRMIDRMKEKVNDFISEEFPRLGYKKSTRLSGIGGRAQGMRDGSTMNLGTGSRGQRRIG